MKNVKHSFSLINCFNYSYYFILLDDLSKICEGYCQFFYYTARNTEGLQQNTEIRLLLSKFTKDLMRYCDMSILIPKKKSIFTKIIRKVQYDHKWATNSTLIFKNFY